MANQDSQPFRWHYTELDDHEFQIRGHTLFFVIVLFAVVILVTLLFLYARWVCRHQQQHFPSSNAYSSHVLRTPPAQHRRGLDPSTIKALPITLHQTSSLGTGGNCNPAVQSECCICLGVFEDGDKVKVLPGCHHGFHCDCLDRWLASQSSCPLCRASLQVVVDSAVV